ncbi:MULTISPECIES: TetR/AcrR family transcriptional regulator C-terminal domain-containing protein [Streptomyces]|uniref:TetR/AcrR family transcriptional regulator C-terminal domain-containing protein n=2 Tax=Streptomyces TaxID=1883 RepID=A0ABU2RJT3_9ACTN|nr:MULTISPECIES: TetR/AcrR family transcriptional regulator C-terminal domain-containing protein [unclassified Streptomyces]MBK3596867.1 TetR/AcrR family transcriptional regulator C-terminal domain-containing protein [Streptomyces sp. MBT51]MDT0428553.1 TetR/AcrR family transcriptional regulator C-terminal domain-containing protein [Streptomyces sp. DSM 41770]HBF83540.1 TetR family transcriptional regulator [Streptomyces sp.]
MTGKNDAAGGTGLSPGIEAAWGLRDRPVKGPKPGLSVDRIVAAAVGVAASEGLGAVSMGRVAKELGASTMALYRYVSAKEELYLLMQEAAMGTPEPLPALESGAGWRAALGEWAWAQRRMFQRNLWALRIPIAGPPASPNSVAWWEQGLQALRGSGLSAGTRISVVLLVSGFVRNEATLMSDVAAAVEEKGVPAEEFMARWERTVRRLVDPVRHPELAGLLGTGVIGEPDGPDHEFEFGLARVLDGIEVFVRREAE